MSSSLIEECRRTGAAVVEVDAVEGRFGERRSVGALRLRSVIGLPIAEDDEAEIIGHVYLDDTRRRGVFDQAATAAAAGWLPTVATCLRRAVEEADDDEQPFAGVIARSARLKEELAELARVATFDDPVLLAGETARPARRGDTLWARAPEVPMLLSPIGTPLALACSVGLLPSLAFAQASVKEFELGGSATLVGDTCIRLTPDEPWQTGSAWYPTPIDLAQPFEMQVDLVLGPKDSQGADGIVFVFTPNKETGWRGEGMGFAGLVPSLGLEFDTYQNDHLLDPPQDHVAAMRHGRSFHGDGVPPVVLPNLEDGQKHPLRIVWSPSAGHLQVHLDGQLVASYPAAVVKETFDGTPVVYWGMTAATGRLSNPQDVCIENLLLG